jgi:hypothetical protein
MAASFPASYQVDKICGKRYQMSWELISLKKDSRLFPSFREHAICHNVAARFKGGGDEAARVETPVEADGELHLTGLPCRRGDKVEAIVLILEQPSRPAPVAERE